MRYIAQFSFFFSFNRVDFFEKNTYFREQYVNAICGQILADDARTLKYGMHTKNEQHPGRIGRRSDCEAENRKGDSGNAQHIAAGCRVWDEFKDYRHQPADRNVRH